MKTLNKSGIESGAKYLTFLSVLALAFLPVNLQAGTVWESGHHEIFDGDVYAEIGIYNDVRLDIFGGDIGYVWAFNDTITNWYGGQMNYFVANDNSIVNIYGGTINIGLGGGDNSEINLYAYDISITHTGGHWDVGQVTGKYYANDTSFIFDLWGPDTYLHINIVPEPATFLLLALGVLGIRRRK